MNMEALYKKNKKKGVIIIIIIIIIPTKSFRFPSLIAIGVSNGFSNGFFC